MLGNSVYILICVFLAFYLELGHFKYICPLSLIKVRWHHLFWLVRI